MDEAMPKNTRDYIDSIAALLAGGDAEGAESCCQQGLIKFPNSVWLHFHHAEIAMKLKKFGEAVERWAIFRNLMPDNPEGYSRAVAALMQCGDLYQAESLCLEGLARFPKFKWLLFHLAEIAVKNKNFQTAVMRWQKYDREFPEDWRGGVNAVKNLVAAKQYAAAREEAAKIGERFPDNKFLLYQMARIEFCLGNNDLAADKCGCFLQKFGANLDVYLTAIRALRKQSEFGEAEKMCLEAMRHYPNSLLTQAIYALLPAFQGQLIKSQARWKKLFKRNEGALDIVHNINMLTLQLDKNYSHLKIRPEEFGPAAYADWRDYAREAAKSGYFFEALLRWKEIIRHYPHEISAYAGAISASQALFMYGEAKRICDDASNLFPKIATFLIHNYNIAKNNHERENQIFYLERIKEKFPDIAERYIYEIELLIAAKEYDEAKKLVREALPKFQTKSILQSYFKILANNFSSGNADEAYAAALSLKEKFHAPYALFNLHSLLKNDKYQEHAEIKAKMSGLFSKFAASNKKFICFCVNSSYGLRYFLYVIKAVSPKLMDIVLLVRREDDDEIIKKFGLSNYKILYGKNNILNYKNIAGDVLLISSFTEEFEHKIGLIHAVDNFGLYNGNLDLLILSSQNQVILSERIVENLDIEMRQEYRVEIACTGIYHTEKFYRIYKNRPDFKFRIRKYLKQKYGINFSQKKVIFFLEDEASHFGQCCWLLNKLADEYTIILKPLYSKFSSLLKKLDSGIFVVDDDCLAPNIFRFCADFIFAGYASGSFVSSVMLGIPVVPYYSKYVYNKSLGGNINSTFKYVRDYRWLIEIPNTICKKELTDIFMREGYFFNLTNMEKIRRAISGEDFLNWYNTNIESIQARAFGKYRLLDAAKTTADYMLRYCMNGTLGKDAPYLYLKDKFLDSKG